MDVDLFEQMSRLPELLDILTEIIFPGIYDNEHIKKSMVLSLFINQQQQQAQNHEYNANEHLHILLLGSSCEEIMSQLLKSITQVINKSNYILGNQSSLRLLAASFNKQGWLVGKGSFMNTRPAIICIDGLEKMDFNQQHLIIQSIEHQLVTHKSGRCGQWFFHSNSAILATAYSKEFAHLYKLEQNTSVSKHLLSRFDLIFSLEKSAIGEKQSVFIKRMKKEKQNYNTLASQKLKSMITVPIVNSFIAYCNAHINPFIPEEIVHLIEQCSQQDQPHLITCRYRLFVSISNLAKSHARLHMREEVGEDDLAVALELLASSLTFSKPERENIQSQSIVKNINCKPSSMLKLLNELFSTCDKKQFTLDELLSVYAKLSDTDVDRTRVMNSLETLNEQGLIVKRNSKIYELV